MNSVSTKLHHDLQLFEDSEGSQCYNYAISFLENLLPVKPKNIEELLIMFAVGVILYIWFSSLSYNNCILRNNEISTPTYIQDTSEDTAEEYLLESKEEKKKERVNKRREREEKRRKLRKILAEIKEQQEKQNRINERLKRREEKKDRRKKKIEKIETSNNEMGENEEIENTETSNSEIGENDDEIENMKLKVQLMDEKEQ